MHTKFYIRSFTHSWDIKGYRKKIACHVTGPRPFSWKIIKGICLAYHCEYVHQILHS